MDTKKGIAPAGKHRQPEPDPRQLDMFSAPARQADGDQPPDAETAQPPMPAAPKIRKDAANNSAAKQREISVSEFFTKNRHLLGFDNPQKALLTAVKEAVDNSLDACEEAGVLPEISVEIIQVSDNRYRVAVEDNGPGIVKNQIPKIFGKLLYGSKFHSIKQSRGQQGIGISAAGMYGQLTTGKAMKITSRIGADRPAHYYEIQIDTRKNAPIILIDKEIEWGPEHGTRVEIELEAVYKKGRRSVDDFIDQTALANPHGTFRYSVTGETPRFYDRVSNALPKEPVEIKPHPYGVELGMLMRMMSETDSKTLSRFFQHDFSRVSPRLSEEVCNVAGVSKDLRPSKVIHGQAELLYNAISKVKFMAPPTNCLSPIGEELILEGLKKQFKADVYFAVTRPPAVYRGNPFQVEAGVAWGGDLPGDDTVQLFRFANRVPLLYQQSGCAIFKSSVQTSWRGYDMQQPRGALPVAPMVLLVHIASVWVPFTSESKEAIAHYPDIIKEIRLALMECGRHISAHIRRHKREHESDRKRSYIIKYIPHLALGLRQILDLDQHQETSLIQSLVSMLEKTRLEV
ncbi:MAG: DNA topoisomerase VI subunit B [Myxococcota bacterium]|jgi:DNA topoisomerase-6 subunit B